MSLDLIVLIPEAATTYEQALSTYHDEDDLEVVPAIVAMAHRRDLVVLDPQDESETLLRPPR